MIPDIFYTIDTISQHILPILEKQLIYSSALFGLILLTTYLLKKRSMYWHLGLWSLFLLRLLLPPDLSHQWSAGNLLSRFIDQRQIVIQTAETSDRISEEFTQPATMSEEIAAKQRQNLPNIARTQTFSDIVIRVSWAKIALFLTWMAGSMFVATRYGIQLRRHYHIITNASPIEDAGLLAKLRDLRTQIGVRRAVRLVTSSECAAAFTIGVLSPAIFLPQRLLDPDTHACIEPILAHELIHVKRYDALRSLIHNLFQAFYFFNPCVWYAVRRLHLAQECICDQQAVTRCRIAPKTYAHSLLNAIELRIIAPERSVLPAFSNWKQTIAYRITYIQGGKTMRRSQRFIIFATMLVLGIFVLPMAKSSIQASNTAKPSSNSQDEFSQSFENLRITTRAEDTIYDGANNKIRSIGGVQTIIDDGNNVAHIQAKEFALQRDPDERPKAFAITSGTISVDGFHIEAKELTIQGSDPFLVVDFLQAFFTQDPGLINGDFKSEDLHVDKGSTTFTATNVSSKDPSYITLNSSRIPFNFNIEKVTARHEPADIFWNVSGKRFRIDANPLLLTLSGRVSLTLGEIKLEGTDITVHYPPRPSEETALTFVSPSKYGRISANFGYMSDPFTQEERFHRGIDIAVKVGTEVYAVADGTVLPMPEEDDGYGKNLIIQHKDGFTSRYAKLSEILVREGQTVKADEKIALSGNTGVSTGPHLHFELQRYDSHKDPAEWIDFTALESPR